MEHPLRAAMVTLAAAAVTLGSLGGPATATSPPEPTPEPGVRSHAASPDIVEEGAADGAIATGRGHDQQHGGREGHLLPRRKNVRVVGKAAVRDRGEDRIGDVEVYRRHAYLAGFHGGECKEGGVYVMNVRKLRKPRQVGFIPTGEGSYVGEGVQARRIRTDAFRGDLLLFNNEICNLTEGSVGGATLVDVTRPRNPRVLASGFGDMTPEGVAPGVAHQVHSAFMWQHGKKAYAVLVDDEEAQDVDIFDISNPRKPTLVAEYSLAEEFPQIVQEGLGEVFLHDMVVRRNRHGREIMLLSYWDAGYVKIDVTNPRRIRYIADTDYRKVDPELREQAGIEEAPEGNGHQAEFTKKMRYIIATDEDFSPYELRGMTDDGTEIQASSGSDTPQLGGGQTISDTAVFAGRACTETGDDPDVPPAPAEDGPYFAVVERGVCTFTEKVAAVEAANAGGGTNYTAVLVMNREGPDACSTEFGMSVEGNLRTFSIGRDVGFSLFDAEAQYDEAACLAGDGSAQAPFELGQVGDVVTLESFFNGWGYVHLYANGAGKLLELDTYAVPEAMDPRFAERFGDLSVHEVATSRRSERLAYLAYYAAGFRVVKIKDGELRGVGSFIDEEGNNFWGVEVFRRNGREYVAASDRAYGLYIFRYTGKP